MSVDERSYKLAILEMESFVRLGKEGSEPIAQVMAGIARGMDGSSLARKGVCKQRLFQTILVTTRVGTSRRDVCLRRLVNAVGVPAPVFGTQSTARRYSHVGGHGPHRVPEG